MARWFRPLAALEEDLSLNLAPMWQLTTTMMPSLKNVTLSGFCEHNMSYTQMRIKSFLKIKFHLKPLMNTDIKILGSILVNEM